MEKNYEGERVGCYHCGRQDTFRAAEGWRHCALKYGAGGYFFCSAKCRHGEDCREIGARRPVTGSPAPCTWDDACISATMGRDNQVTGLVSKHIFRIPDERRDARKLLSAKMQDMGDQLWAEIRKLKGWED